MAMIRRLKDDSILLLSTNKRVLYPGIRQNIVHGGPLAGVDLQHAADDMPGFSWEQPEETDGPLNGRWVLVRVGGRSPRNGPRAAGVCRGGSLGDGGVAARASSGRGAVVRGEEFILIGVRLGDEQAVRVV